MTLRPPKPAVSWTETHKENETIEGTVTGRHEHTSKATGEPFTILEVVTDDNETIEIMCGRAGLRKFVEANDPRKGDRIAITFWGKADMAFVYTGAIAKAISDPEPKTSELLDLASVHEFGNWDAPPPDEYAE